VDPAPPFALGAPAAVINLPGIDAVLPAELLERQPQMCRLVAEDAVLVFEWQQWHARRPRWWQLPRNFRWHQDGLALVRRRADLSSFVAAYRADR
jgi:hypothetical protein